MMSFKLLILFACMAKIAYPLANLEDTPLARLTRQVLNAMIPRIMLLEYNNTPSREGYRFNYKTDDDSFREEVGIIMNPGASNEELVVMGAYGYTDSVAATVTMYTADKKGYRPRVQVKRGGVPAKLLTSLAG